MVVPGGGTILPPLGIVLSENGGKMEIYREQSHYNASKLEWLLLAIVVLMVWISEELKSVLVGRPSLVGSGYIVCFIGLLVWRYAVRYTYSLTKQNLIIISQFLWFSRIFILDLNSIECYSERYVKNMVKHDGIKRYIYRYSSGDDNPTRIIIFHYKGERQAVLIRVQECFFDELRRLLPGRERGMASQ